MTDRRKAKRFAFTKPAAAHLHVLHDVIIEHSDAQQLIVLATASSAPGEELAIRLRGADGRAVTLTVHTVETRPVMVDGAGLRYRLNLRVSGTDRPAHPVMDVM
jgi:hypothetical protein